MAIGPAILLVTASIAIELFRFSILRLLRDRFAQSSDLAARLSRTYRVDLLGRGLGHSPDLQISCTSKQLYSCLSRSVRRARSPLIDYIALLDSLTLRLSGEASFLISDLF